MLHLSPYWWIIKKKNKGDWKHQNKVRGDIEKENKTSGKLTLRQDEINIILKGLGICEQKPLYFKVDVSLDIIAVGACA